MHGEVSGMLTVVFLKRKMWWIMDTSFVLIFARLLRQICVEYKELLVNISQLAAEPEERLLENGSDVSKE